MTPGPVSKQDGLFAHLEPGSPSFATGCAAALLRFGRDYSTTEPIDERWSLVECGLQKPDWDKILQWAYKCPKSEVPSAGSLTSGILILAISTAVGRLLEQEGLWQAVSASCSPVLREELFGTAEYPVNDSRDAMEKACSVLGVRHQLHLPGKHRYWRTVQLQFGFSAKAIASHLPTWLAGYNVPDTMRALLTEGDENGSLRFRELWSDLEKLCNGSKDPQLDARLRSNAWYPGEAHHFLKNFRFLENNRNTPPEGRLEDAETNPTIFGPPRIFENEFALSLARRLPSEIKNSSKRILRILLEGIPSSLIERDAEGRFHLAHGPIHVLVTSVLQKPTRDVYVQLEGGTVYRQRFAFWEQDQDLVFFGGSGGPSFDLSRFCPKVGSSYAVIARGDIRLKTATEELSWSYLLRRMVPLSVSKWSARQADC